MARGEQLGRQWKIIQILLASSRGKAASELAEETGFHKRTIYRDLEALQHAGFPLYTEHDDSRTFWSMLDAGRSQTPLPVSLTELMALYFSRDMLKIFKDTLFYDSLESFFQKIKAMLPPGAVQYLGQVEQTLRVDIKPYKTYARYADVIRQVNEAALARRVVDIRYFSQSRKAETRRRAAPYKVWFFDGTFYMIGYCHLRKEIRTFSLDRIRDIRLTDETFEIPEDFSFDDIMAASFGVYSGAPEQVRIRFDADVAGHIREKIWHESQTLAENEDGSLIFEADVAVTRELQGWILRWGAGAKVLAPASLKQEIQDEIRRMGGQYR